MISHAPSLKTCPKCRSELPAGAAFCPVCGLQALDVCWTCGEPLKGDWAYCPHCGTSAGETGVIPCPGCREPVARGYRYCPWCGVEARRMCEQCGEILRREWHFCPECGTEAGAGDDEAAGEPDHRGRAEPEQAEPSLPPIPAPAAGGRAAELNERGTRAYDDNQLEEAIRYFRQAIDADPGNAAYHVNLAVALEENGETEEAIAACRRALALDPDSQSAYLNLGYIFSEHERYDEAREAWEQVIRLDPRSPEAREARNYLQHLDEL